MRGNRRLADKKQPKKFWLYLHPYVHVNIKGNRVLLYNTLNGRALEWEDQPEILAIVKKLVSRHTLYVVCLAEEKITPGISTFIQALRNDLSGDWVDAALSSCKPVQFLPRACLPGITPGRWRKDLRGEVFMEYWESLNLFLTDDCRQECARCESSYRQFTTCTRHLGSGGWSIDELTLLLRESWKSQLKTINLLGGDIFLHPDFFQLVDRLRQVSTQRHVFFTDYRNIPDDPRFLKTLRYPRAILKVIVGFPLDSVHFEHLLHRLHGTGIQVRWKWVVADENELGAAGNRITRHELRQAEISPYFTGENLDFFQMHVFLQKGNLLKKPLPMTEIFARQTLNRLNFGNLTIASDRRVYANVNHRHLGRWGQQSVFYLLEKELRGGQSWGRHRGQVKPCRDCVYQYLCPPISNYEYALGRFNPCHVFGNES